MFVSSRHYPVERLAEVLPARGCLLDDQLVRLVLPTNLVTASTRGDKQRRAIVVAFGDHIDNTGCGLTALALVGMMPAGYRR